MKLSYDTINNILERYSGRHIMETASEYGEPGYSHNYGADTPLIVLGDYWCRCGATSDEGMHSIDWHHPRVWAQMEKQGVQFEWHDEWMVDYDSDKAYRTTGDSYTWTPSVVFTDYGDPLTPDSDILEWIEWATDDPAARCLMPFHRSTLETETEFVEYGDRYESGWYAGQDADPKQILAEIRKWHGDDTDVVFMLRENSQFYLGFAAYYRPETDAS